MAGRREWVPASNWGSTASLAAGTANSTITSWGEDELYLPYAADSATFLRLRGHIVLDEVIDGDGLFGWRVRMGLDDLQAGGPPATAGDLDDGEVAEEHFLDERFWWYDGTAQPSAGDHPYYYTFDTTSKRKLQSPQTITVTGINLGPSTIRVTVFLRALFLFP